MTTASELRSRVRFSERITVSGAGGVTREGWIDQFTVSAAIRPRLGGETIIAARLGGSQPVTISVRRSGMTAQIRPNWRAVDARTGTVYNIRSIVDPSQHSPDHDHWIDILAEAGVTT